MLSENSSIDQFPVESSSTTFRPDNQSPIYNKPLPCWLDDPQVTLPHAKGRILSRKGLEMVGGNKASPLLLEKSLCERCAGSVIAQACRLKFERMVNPVRDTKGTFNSLTVTRFDNSLEVRRQAEDAYRFGDDPFAHP